MTPLHYIGQFLREAMSMVPLMAVRAMFVASLVVLLVWVLRLPSEATRPAGRVHRWDENLKVGASIAIVIQILIYSFF